MGIIGKSVLDVANRAKLQKVDVVALEATKSTLDTHTNVSASNAHVPSNILGLSELLDGKSFTGHHHTVSDVTGLDRELNNKANKFTGYTGSFTIITGVNFAGQSITTKTVTVSNGIVVSVV